MEIEGTGRSKTLIKPGQTREFGRGQGFKLFNSTDKTISRHHVSFYLPENESRINFHVIGKNPIWVHTSKTNEIKAFRSTEKGEMESGDMFCVSAKNPIWFTLKKTEIEVLDDGGNENEVKRESCLEGELAESLHCGSGPKGVEELEPESVDISGIDPIKEFEFVVMGHEFDRYPKKMIRDIENFDWFLEEPGKDSDDDEKKVKEGRRKRKKGEQNDDEWTGESEDDKEVITKSRNVKRRKYTTRSKDRNKLDKDTSKSKRTTGMKSRNVDDEDEDDETLGGFIVTDEDSEQEEEDVDGEEEDEEQEEEFVDDFDEEDDE